MSLPKEKVGEARQELLIELKKQLKPPTQDKELLPLFYNWCRAEGLNIKEQKLGGDNFIRFKKSLEENYQGACKRADALVHLFQMVRPMAMGFESTWQGFYGDGWNDCLVAAIEQGEIPPIDNKKYTNNTRKAIQAGWNAAVEKLKEYTGVFD